MTFPAIVFTARTVWPAWISRKSGTWRRTRLAVTARQERLRGDRRDIRAEVMVSCSQSSPDRPANVAFGTMAFRVDAVAEGFPGRVTPS